MIKSKVGHIQFNVDQENMPFYQDLMPVLGWSVWCDEQTIFGAGNEHDESLWFVSPAKANRNDYDGPGMNHIGLSVGSQAEVDEVVGYLKTHDISALFETPRHRPEFCSKPDHTYYQVMFKSPDGILFEVVYTGPKDS